MLDNNGYVGPVAAALFWLPVRLAPFNYHVTLGASVLLGLLLDWSVWVCLRTYLGRTPLTVVWFAMVVLSPLWVMVAAWWSVAAAVLIAASAMAWMLTAAKRYADGNRWRHALAVVAAYAIAILATPKSALLAAFLAVFVVCCLVEGRLGRRLWIVLRYWIPVWLGLLLVTSAWLVGYISLATSRSTRLSVLTNAWALFRESFLGTFLPSLLGGPWTVGPGPLPFPYFGALSAFAILVVVQVIVFGVVGLRGLNRRSALPLLPVAVMVVGNLVLLGWAAISFYGPEIGRQGRYWTDLLLPTVLCLALMTMPASATTPTRLVSPDRRRRRTRIVAAVSLFLFANSAMFTITTLGDSMRSATGATFLSNAVQGLHDEPDVVIWDRGMPSQIIDPFIFPGDGQASRALRYWVTDQRFDVPTEQFRLFDDAGVLRKAKLLATATSIPGPAGSCGYLATATPSAIRFPGPLYRWRWVIQLSYLANSEFTATAKVGDAVVALPIHRGLHQVFFVAVASFSEIVVSTPSSTQGMCIDFAAAGNLGAE